MKKQTRKFAFRGAIVATIAVIGCTFAILTSMLMPTVLNASSWLLMQFDSLLGDLHGSIQAHPDGWFRWAVVVLAVFIGMQLRSIKHELIQARRRNDWQTQLRGTRYMSPHTYARKHPSSELARLMKNQGRNDLGNIGFGNRDSMQSTRTTDYRG